jgi:hypothetical protein
MDRIAVHGSKGEDCIMRRLGVPVAAGLAAGTLLLFACQDPATTESDPALARGGHPAQVASGKTIFRFDTFGDETFWTDTLQMHSVISASLTPTLALQLGLKVDVDALPASLRADLAAGKVDLGSPATTVALLKLGAVVGLVGTVSQHRGQFLRCGDRQAARRVAQPGPRPGQDHRALALSPSGRAGGGL